MHRYVDSVIVCAILSCGWFASVSPVRGADILFTATGTFDWNEAYQQGFDQFGLDGASFVFTAAFSDSALYQNFYDGYPGIHSLYDSLTISGATSPEVNGTYAAGGFGVIFLPTFTGQFFGDASFDNGGGYAAWQIDPGHKLRLNRLTTQISGPTIGSPFLASHISTTPFPVSLTVMTNGSTAIDLYSITSFQASVTAVPEPSSLICAALAGGVFILGFVCRKPRRLLV
jgi:hypothetical protein